MSDLVSQLQSGKRLRDSVQIASPCCTELPARGALTIVRRLPVVHAISTAQRLLIVRLEDDMSLVRLLGFTTLACGCVVGRYREVATSREVTYVEE